MIIGHKNLKLLDILVISGFEFRNQKFCLFSQNIKNYARFIQIFININLKYPEPHSVTFLIISQDSITICFQNTKKISNYE